MSALQLPRPSRPRTVRIIWCAAFLFSISLHVGLAAAVLHKSADALEASEDQGLAIVMELAPLPVAQMAEQPGEPAPDTPEAAAAPPSPPVPEIEEKLSTQAASDQPKAEPTPYEAPPDSLARKETEKKEENKPDEAEATDKTERQEAAPAAAAAAPSISGAPALHDDDASAAPKEGATLEARQTPESWQRALLQHLGKHKRYPYAARSKRIEGAANLEFNVTASGAIVEARIVTSSGSPLLDQEALAMLARAQPVPRLPAGLGAQSVKVRLPIRFKLR